MSNDFVKIDTKEFLRLLKVNKYGTGSVRRAVHAKSDEIQRLIALNGGPKELVNALVNLLGPSLLDDEADEVQEIEVVEEVEDVVEEIKVVEVTETTFNYNGATIDSILSAIEEGLISKEEAIDFELGKDKPRQTLLVSLE